MTRELSGGEWLEKARALKQEGWWLADLCGIDAIGLERGAQGRFEVVVQFLHHARKERTSVRVKAEGDPPTLPSVVELWPSVDFMEREAFDMFGIVFDGHPNLTRILMPEEWEGHPLRKDYGVGKVPVEFVAQPFLQVEGPGQAPNPREAGIEVDRLGQPKTDDPHARGKDYEPKGAK